MGIIFMTIDAINFNFNFNFNCNGNFNLLVFIDEIDNHSSVVEVW